MAHCAVPARYQRDVTIIVVNQGPCGEWCVADNRGLDCRCADRAEAMRIAHAECRGHPGSVVLAMPPLGAGAGR